MKDVLARSRWVDWIVFQGLFSNPRFPTIPYVCVVSVCGSRGEVDQSGECTGILKEVPEPVNEQSYTVAVPQAAPQGEPWPYLCRCCSVSASVFCVA